MPESRIQRIDRLNLDEVCEKIADGSPVDFIQTCYPRNGLLPSNPRARDNIGALRLGRYLSPAKNNPHRRSLRPMAISPREWEPDIPTFAAP